MEGNRNRNRLGADHLLPFLYTAAQECLAVFLQHTAHQRVCDPQGVAVCSGNVDPQILIGRIADLPEICGLICHISLCSQVDLAILLQCDRCHPLRVVENVDLRAYGKNLEYRSAVKGGKKQYYSAKHRQCALKFLKAVRHPGILLSAKISDILSRKIQIN